MTLRDILHSIEDESADLCNIIELIKIIERNHDSLIPQKNSDERTVALHQLESNNQTDFALAAVIHDRILGYKETLNNLISQGYNLNN